MLPGFDPAPAAAPKYHHFDFTVTGMSRADAERLLGLILDECEYYAATVGGGFAEVTEDGAALAGDASNDTQKPA